jgi:hypothetical protein
MGTDDCLQVYVVEPAVCCVVLGPGLDLIFLIPLGSALDVLLLTRVSLWWCFLVSRAIGLWNQNKYVESK